MPKNPTATINPSKKVCEDLHIPFVTQSLNDMLQEGGSDLVLPAFSLAVVTP